MSASDDGYITSEEEERIVAAQQAIDKAEAEAKELARVAALTDEEREEEEAKEKRIQALVKDELKLDEQRDYPRTEEQILEEILAFIRYPDFEDDRITGEHIKKLFDDPAEGDKAREAFFTQERARKKGWSEKLMLK